MPHYHPRSPEPVYQAAADPTYEEARWSYDLDKRRYLHWRDQGGLARDAAKVREILGIDEVQLAYCRKDMNLQHPVGQCPYGEGGPL